MDSGTRHGRGTRLLIAAVVVAGIAAPVVVATPAGAATTTIKATGATITRSDATAGTTLTVAATVARLDLWCSSNKLVVNKKATTIPCNKLLSVTTTGLTGNDWVEANATGFGSSLPKTTLAIKTGSGNDTINVRHRSTLTVYAGAGNDTIAAGFGAGTRPVTQTLRGDDGNDKITTLDELVVPVTGPFEVYDPPNDQAVLDGGPGADRFLSEGSTGRISVLADLDDSIETSNVSLTITTGSGNDTITVHNEFAKGTTLTATRATSAATTTRTIRLPDILEKLSIDTQGGNDSITATGSYPNWRLLALVGGAGADAATFRYTWPCTHEPAKRQVTCDIRTTTYAADVEKVTFVPFA